MKNKTIVLLALVLAFLLPQAAHAQTELATTTITSAMDAITRTMVTAATLTASTNNAKQYAYIDQEAIEIVTVNGGTSTVIRGQLGSAAMAHADDAPVWYGPAARFLPQGARRDGACPQTPQFAPFIEPQTGDFYDCRNGVWQRLNLGIQYHRAGVVEVSDAAYTLTPRDRYVNVLTLTAGRTFTMFSVTNQPGFEIDIMNLATTNVITLNIVNGQTIGDGGTHGTREATSVTIGYCGNAGVGTTALPPCKIKLVSVRKRNYQAGTNTEYWGWAIFS